MCSRQQPCLNETNRVIDVQNQLKNEELVYIDYRPPNIIVINSTVLTDLKQAGILEPEDTFFDYNHVLLRLMVNPSTDFREIIFNERSRVFQKRPVLGIQIRAAGLLADSKESVSFIDEEALKKVPSIVIDTIRQFEFDKKIEGIYLSTDSRIVDQYLQETLEDKYRILKTDMFRRGHSTGSPKEDVVKRALLDLYMLAECDGLLTTQGSGFGGIARALSLSPLQATIPVERKTVVVPRRGRKKLCVCLSSILSS